jgi:hypothetical protein
VVLMDSECVTLCLESKGNKNWDSKICDVYRRI